MRVKSIFYWPSMKTEIFRKVSECDVCQRVKKEQVHSPGLIQPLSIPEHAWHDISLDFVEGLPFSGQKSAI